MNEADRNAIMAVAGEYKWDVDTQKLQAASLLELVRLELLGFGEKLTPGDVTPELHLVADEWAARYQSDEPFEYLVDMKMAAIEGTLSVNQAKGVLNCMRAEARRSQQGRDVPTQGTSGSARVKPNGEYPVTVGKKRYVIQLSDNDFSGGNPDEQIAAYQGVKKPWVRFAFVKGGRINVWKHYVDDERLREAVEKVLA